MTGEGREFCIIGRLGNYGAKFSKMHTVGGRGVLWSVKGDLAMCNSL